MIFVFLDIGKGIEILGLYYQFLKMVVILQKQLVFPVVIHF